MQRGGEWVGETGVFSLSANYRGSASRDPSAGPGLESRPKHISVLSKHHRMPLFEMFQT